jgi:hypothetical protein
VNEGIPKDSSSISKYLMNWWGFLMGVEWRHSLISVSRALSCCELSSDARGKFEYWKSSCRIQSVRVEASHPRY